MSDPGSNPIPNSANRSAFRLSVGYVFLSVIWIIFSDTLVHRLFPDHVAELFLSILKGMFFVGVTGLLLFWLLRRELTARQAHTETFRRQFEQYRQVFRQCEEGIAFLDMEGIVQYANPAAEALFGKGSGELIGSLLGIPILVGKELEIEVSRLDGAPRSVEFRLSEVFFSGETGYAAILRDVTERKAGVAQLMVRETEIRNQFAELDQLYRFAPVGLFAVDREYKFVRANEQVSNLNGLPVESFLEKPVAEIVPDFETRLRGIFDSVLNEGQVFQNLEVERALAIDRERLHHFLVNYFPLRLGSGEIVGILGSVQDITHRKQAEETMRQVIRELAEFKAAVDVSSFIIVTNPSGIITHVNEHFCRLAGYPEAELVGQPYDILKSDFHPPSFFQNLWETLEEGKVWSGEIRNRRKDGSFFWVKATWVPILDESNRPTQFISIKHDITEQRETVQLFKNIVTGISVNFGMEFYRSLVVGLVQAIKVEGALVAALETGADGGQVLQTLATFWRGAFHETLFEGKPDDETGWETSGREVLEFTEWCSDTHKGPTVREALGVEQSFTIQLRDRAGNFIGLLSLLGEKPPRFDEGAEAALKIFATLAETELERHRTAVNLRTLNQELENRVEQRTRQLELANHELRELANLQQAIFDASNYAIVTTDNRGRIRLFNRAAEILTGYAADDLVGRKSPLIFHDLDEMRDRVRALSADVGKSIEFPYDFFMEMIRLHPTTETEWTIIRADGTRLPVRESISGIRDASGTTNGLLGILTDITLEKNAQALLLRQAEDMREANLMLKTVARHKDEFIASVSHELRTPLNAILGMSESLLEDIYGPVSEKQAKAIRTVQESGTHLLNLINDILDLAKVEAGKLEAQFDRVAVGSLCQSAMRLVRETAIRKKIRISIGGEGLGEVIVTDERRLKQILMNLLGNAVKFTPTGGAIGLMVEPDATRENLVFRVWDTGIGIAEDQQSRLFQPFVQLDSRLSRQFGGTGLGLSLVDRLTRLLGGSVSLESRLGEGSRFEVSLPFRRSAVKTPPTPPALRIPTPAQLRTLEQNWTILLAEDIEDNVSIIVDFLETKHLRVVVARDGNEVLAKVTEIHPDLILMDVQMPGVDGIEATHRIRHLEGCANLPIIAITALAKPEDRERCLAAGMNDYLSKPFSLRELHSRIVSLLRKTGSQNN